MPPGESDYSVGYGRPPAHTRFVKGRSGNPRGRPRGKSLARLLQEALAAPVTVETDGRRHDTSIGEAVIDQLIERALNADLRSTKLLLDTLQRVESRGRPRYFPPGGYPDEDEEEGEDPREFLIRELDRLAAAQAEDAATAEEPTAPDTADAPSPDLPEPDGPG